MKGVPLRTLLIQNHQEVSYYWGIKRRGNTPDLKFHKRSWVSEEDHCYKPSQKDCRTRRHETILEIRKKTTLLEVINKTVISMFLKDFTKNRNKTNKADDFSHMPPLNIVKNRAQRWDFPAMWKWRFFFQHILKSLTNMYRSSSSPFFRTPTRIQSGPDTSEESKSVMVFLNILGVTRILYSLRYLRKVFLIATNERSDF